jgi:hypothetical protein
MAGFYLLKTPGQPVQNCTLDLLPIYGLTGLCVLVTGGRDYKDSEVVKRTLDAAQPKVLIQGEAQGADRLALWWARANNIHCAQVQAYWQVFGSKGPKNAGYMRNQAMADMNPGLVVAFPGGSGTEDMCRRAAHLPMLIYIDG